MKNCIYIAAGGTGGHINAALALEERIEKKVIFFSSRRHLDFRLFKGKDCRHLNVSSIRFNNNPLSVLKSIINNFLSFLKVMGYFIKERPQYVIGAGGYVCGPVLLAAYMFRVPLFIIEQNAVMGLTNKILSYFAKKVFINFPDTKRLPTFALQKTSVVGNPIRRSILHGISNIGAVEKKEDTLNLLVFGGSLGATQINELVGILCTSYTQKKLYIKHQVGKNKKISIQPLSNIRYKQFEYIENIAQEYAWSDLIVSRAGASTISELRVVQKPCALIPFPYATDNHQYYNALNLKREAAFPILILDQKKDIKSLLEQLVPFLNAIGPSSVQRTVVEDSSLRILSEIQKCLE